MIRAHTETRCYSQSPFFPTPKQRLSSAIFFYTSSASTPSIGAAAAAATAVVMYSLRSFHTGQVPTAAAAVVVGVDAAPARSRLSALKPKPRRTYKYWICIFLGYYTGSTYANETAKFQ